VRDRDWIKQARQSADVARDVHYRSLGYYIDQFTDFTEKVLEDRDFYRKGWTSANNNARRFKKKLDLVEHSLEAALAICKVKGEHDDARS